MQVYIFMHFLVKLESTFRKWMVLCLVFHREALAF
jgi:hypothetical protein